MTGRGKERKRAREEKSDRLSGFNPEEEERMRGTEEAGLSFAKLRGEEKEPEELPTEGACKYAVAIQIKSSSLGLAVTQDTERQAERMHAYATPPA
ncbi:hypothetical protein EYF80_013279 [Liparis tanakae]|uniref:Uncharacterized protein n=1 Tax=Liparis tanakae TaxID=230148 RepID=A0A4Z2IG63_9TELE|nr:hypothetical protein EYF80_013279 [Liparis tanakae]